MTPFISSLAFGAGVAGWVYNKVGPRLGYGNPKSVYTTAGLAGLGAFIVFYTFLRFVLGM